MRLRALVPVLFVVVAACSNGGGDAATTAAPTSPDRATVTTAPAITAAPPTGLILADGSTLGPAPPVPTGPLDPGAIADLDLVFDTLLTGVDVAALARLGQSGDARVAWLIADLLRFFQRGEVFETSVESFEALTGSAVDGGFVWGVVTDRLIAWDLPQPPGYVKWKRVLFEIIEPGWGPFFADPGAEVDWRYLSWGGVLIDDRPLDAVTQPCPEGCIPALDDPAVTDAAGGDWYPDERVVFGLVVNGDARAYPKNIMEIHEMVNDTLGGRRIGLPYCTLCGSAQAYLTDAVPDGFGYLELRTSGLLSRSNKVMFDLITFSMFDTFLGVALTGPLREAEFTLEPISVVTSTWGDWKTAHPNTTIVAEDGGIGRTYVLDPLGGRDDDGPIFPIGNVDPRLPVQEQVLGVVAPDGTAIAFGVAAAQSLIDAGRAVELAGVVIVSDGAGLVAQLGDGTPIPSNQSFWFAWSQFHPGTLLWTPLG